MATIIIPSLERTTQPKTPNNNKCSQKKSKIINNPSSLNGKQCLECCFQVNIASQPITKRFALKKKKKCQGVT